MEEDQLFRMEEEDSCPECSHVAQVQMHSEIALYLR